VKIPGKILLVIAGPTAVGKTALAIQLAKSFRAEIVSADSRQIFRELTIGTAKPSQQELHSVKHHFIDTLSIGQPYDAARFGEEALEVIRDIFTRFDVAILCGGSGLYIKAVCEGFDEIPEIPAHIRREIMQQYDVYGIRWLQQQMHVLDPELFKKLDQQNPHRLVRALEVKMGTGMSLAAFQKREKRKLDFAVIKLGLELPRAELYTRIDQRMENMIEAGLFEEAEGLYPFKDQQALQTVGYQEIFGFLDGEYDRDETIRLLKRNSRRYAKRQLTWFRRDPELTWLHPGEMNEILRYLEARIASLKI
jgi:tRNA dimethylallyltransferase